MTHANATRVFVYGMLQAGEVDDLRVAAIKRGVPEPELFNTTTLHGRLYDFGAYPDLVLNPTGTAIRNGVCCTDAALVPVLSEIEGAYPGGDALFLHEGHLVMLGNEPVNCTVYPVGSQHATGRPVITGGD